MVVIALSRLFVACICLLIALDDKHVSAGNPKVYFILVGATGNLAQKYLWQNIYDLKKSNDNIEFGFYGGARANYSAGSSALQRILSNDVKYESENEKETFMASINYVQLKTCDDYEKLCQSISVIKDDTDDEYCEVGGSCDADNKMNDKITKWTKCEQIFYLSVPPYTYGELGDCISRVCKSESSKTKIVLEKPYGSDVKTVNDLINALRPLYDEDEVYLVDHYLGKTVVRNILPFRYDNREWLEPLLNRDHVERIEVVIKEKETAKGRLNYYDSYGVFLDIIQNHAVELLTLISMDLTVKEFSETTSTDLVQLKMRFLDSITPISPHNLVFAQYGDYVDDGRSEFNNQNFTSITPTFGAVLLQSSSHRWTGVPMLILSGKALDSKSSYVRILFKNNDLFTTNPSRGLKELIFAVSPNFSPEIPEPSIAISTNLITNLKNPNDWVLRGNYHLAAFDSRDRAYFRVVDDVVNSRRENFVSLKQLKSSWDMWTLAIEHLKGVTEISTYGNADLDALAFSRTPNGLQFTSQHPKQSTTSDRVKSEGRITVGSHVEIVKKVVKLISETAKTGIKQHGSFHLAFPGGSTPKMLFQALTSEISFPWELVHIWFVDERCTEQHKPDSNFRNAYENLLRHIRIPTYNIHSMPVELSRGLCVDDDNGVQLYSSLLQNWTNGGVLDVVILGVGTDGHVASLFPQSQHLDSNEETVILTDAPSNVSGVKHRMTLSWSAIKSARLVIVLVTGPEKREVVREIREGSLPVHKFPVKNLLNNDNVYFYVDEQANQKL